MFRSWLTCLVLTLPTLCEALRARDWLAAAPRSEHADEAELAAAALPQGSLRVPIPIQNPGAETGFLNGWSFTPNIWFIYSGIKRSGNYSFVTIDFATRQQTIDLLAAGFTAAELDRSPRLEVRDHIRAFVASEIENYYILTIELLDASNAVLATATGSLTSPEIPAQWKEFVLALSGYPSGARKLRITENVLGALTGVFVDDFSATFLMRKRKL